MKNRKIYCMNNISEKGTNVFREGYELTEQIEECAGVLVRSADMKDMEFPEGLRAIARAGAGVNNIPLDRCAEAGIVVFNTPGANANSVKELVIAGMLIASRDIIGGNEWVREHASEANIGKTAEKAKKAFAGTEIRGKKLGVIGLGAIGVLVANDAVALGMDVYGFDPYLSVVSAWNLSSSVHKAASVEEICAVCDFITIHVPAMDSTKGMINADLISRMKDGVVFLNFARDTLVDEKAMGEALESGKVRKYVSDFANASSVGFKNTIILPHLGASTEESEDNCAIMAVQELTDFMENGNIKNSVNYPNADLGPVKGCRLTVAHKASVSAADIQELLKPFGAVVVDMISKTRGDYAYSMFEIGGCSCSSSSCSELEEKITADGILKVRVISK